ncbi:MAG: hypothetical protein LRY42_02770 [Candidatus Pacebacteria bacterium]|nr:hypothetical protein [Candidatus Paceibacterota bacterium]
MRERDLLKKQRLDIPLLYTFGPYPHSKTLREALRIVRKIFPFRDKRAVSKDHERFYASLGLSPETHTTTADTARAAYLETIEHIRLLFEGNTSGLVQKLTQDMHAHAEKRAFEEAEKIKRQLFALEHIQDIALMHEDDYTLSPKHASKKSVRIEAYDVAHLQGSNPVGVMVVIVDGSIENSQHRVFDIRNGHKGSDVHALEEILVRRLRHTEWAYPTYIVVDGGTAQKRTAERVLKEYNLSIPVISVVKDQRHKPREIRGQAKVIEQYQKWILLANHESHRFALKQHTNKRKKSLA